MTNSSRRPVIVIDFGSPSAQLMARRVREANVYSEVAFHARGAQQILQKKPAAIIVPDGSPVGGATLIENLLEAGVPIFAAGSGFQLLLAALGRKNGAADTRPGELAEMLVTRQGAGDILLDGLPGEFVERVVLPSQTPLNQAPLNQTLPSQGAGDLGEITEAAALLPEGFLVTATASDFPVAGEDRSRGAYGTLWNPALAGSAWGQEILHNFLFKAAKLEPSWTAEAVAETLVRDIRQQVGTSQVICGLSGGVDSSVAAALVHEAVGDQLTCIFVDHGLLRSGEREQVENDYADSMGIRVITVDESQRFLSALEGVSEPEEKRKIIGREFIRSFEDAARAVAAEAASRGQNIEFLTQGTLYPDVVESGAEEGQTNIKSHHNVGGLPEDLAFDLVEPLRELFKEEVRQIGRVLGVPEKIVARQPFPGPGLGIRVVGAVDKERLDILRAADKIVRDELSAAGMDEVIWQCPVVLLADVRSVGVQDDERTYGHPIVLRPVVSEDAMTADWVYLPQDLVTKISDRITATVPEINRVVLDVTPKPPGTIEWE